MREIGKDEHIHRKKKKTSSLYDQVLGVPVLISKEELIAHGEAALGADAGALGAEDALAYPDPDLLRAGDELDCM